MNETKLYTKDNQGSIRIWTIWNEKNTIYTKYGMYGGDLTLKSEPIVYGLANRTVEEQLESRMKSLINKKIDKGYVDTIMKAKTEERTNRLGYKRPAKCARYDKYKHLIPYDTTYIQYKLNGRHCQIINDNGKNVGYGPAGKIFTEIPEIIQEIKIPEGRTLEGEIYHHGTPLQTIGSWATVRQKGTELLKFFFYDIDLPECYSERFEILKNIEHNDRSEFLDTTVIHGKFDIKPLMKDALKLKYEGLILRLLNYPHEPGHASKGILKAKPLHFDEFKIDDEFLIVDIIQSTDGWGILVCITEDGNTFKSSAPGDFTEKTRIYNNRKDYIGKHIRIEYAELTNKKIPFQPVAIEFREKSEE